MPGTGGESRSDLAILIGIKVCFLALTDEEKSLVQDPPNHAAEPMSDGPDGRLVAQPRQQALEHDLEVIRTKCVLKVLTCPSPTTAFPITACQMD